MNANEKPEQGGEQKKPPTTEEIVAKLAADSYEMKKAINAMAQAIIELKGKVEGQAGGGGGTASGSPDPKAFEGLFKWLTGGGEKGSLEEFAKMAESFARTADALEHFRRPVLPYSLGDRLLMRAGAATVARRIVYEGVKGKREESVLSDKEIDKLLGTEGEGEEEGGETEHVKE